jgi:hypothetical protein
MQRPSESEDDFTARQSPETVNDACHHPSIAVEHGSMTLIPWHDIWDSLRGARVRGNGEMIEVFYQTLFKEAVFDDDGAWSKNRIHRG